MHVPHMMLDWRLQTWIASIASIASIAGGEDGEGINTNKARCVGEPALYLIRAQVSLGA